MIIRNVLFFLSGAASALSSAFGAEISDADFYKYTVYNPDLPESKIKFEDFERPAGMSRVQTWWHWQNGNVTREGIRRDLEEMSKNGYGGAVIFNIAASVRGPLDFNSPEWFDNFKYTVDTAAKYGMQIGIHNCDGWSEAGGPWIKPENSMKTLVWEKVRVKGDGREQRITLDPPRHNMDFYRDIAVLAWPAKRPEEMKFLSLLENITPATDETSLPPMDHIMKIFDSDEKTEMYFAATSKEYNSFGITFEFKKPFEAAGIYLNAFRHDVEPPRNLFLEVSSDGVNYEKVLKLDLESNRLFQDFPARTGKFWRIIKYKDENPSFWVRDGHIETHFLIPRELELLAPGETSKLGSYITSLNAKAAIDGHHNGDFPPDPDLKVPASAVVKTKDVKVFKDKLGADGSFSWNVPNGEWEVVRLGYTTTAKTNHPATPEGIGLEVDKFSAKELDHHFDSYIKRMIEASGAHAGKTFKFVETDSWEAGTQNWTEGFDELFKDFNGYSFFKWAPVIMGEVVEGREQSENFLRDFRSLTSNLVMENFYGRLGERLRAEGLWYETEPTGQSYINDPIRSYKMADIPGNEIWQNERILGKIDTAGTSVMNNETASAANFYGKQFVSCESLTAFKGNYADTPLILRGKVDSIIGHGFNLLLFHSYTHQPDERFPGWQMEPWGTAINRKITWWPIARPFFDYISRLQYMMQKGKLPAKVLYLYGDEVPVSGGHMEFPPNVIVDITNGDGVRNYLRVEDGKLVSPGRVKYDMLAMQPGKYYKLETLERVKELVEGGAIVSGAFVEQYNTLKGGKADRAKWNALNKELFGDKGVKGILEIGKGKVYANYMPGELASELGMREEFSSAEVDGDGRSIYWKKRVHDDGTVWYWVVNGTQSKRELVVDFNETGKSVSLWNAEKATRTPAAAVYDDGSRTKVPLTLNPMSNMFVVFENGKPKNSVESYSIDGIERFPTPQTRHSGVKDAAGNFSMSVTVDPRGDREITKESPTGVLNMDSRPFAIYPEAAHLRAPGHRGAGISVGKNSVAVYEHGGGLFTSVLTYDQPIEPNSRIAVVYRDNTPSLYINGKLCKTGTPSSEPVLPTVVPNTNFDGAFANFRVEGRAFDDAEISKDLAFVSDMSEVIEPVLSFADNGKLKAEFFKAGKVSAKMSDGSEVAIDSGKIPAPINVKGPFKVEFDEKYGGPREAVFENLVSWTESADPRIKNYSGIAKYSKTVDIKKPAAEVKAYVEFENVAEVAELWVNGKNVALLWTPPYRAEITGFLKDGKNEIAVKVANTWVNRCLYDATLPESERITWSINMPTFFPTPENAPNAKMAWNQGPIPSGLMGGMKIIFSKTAEQK